MTCPNCGGVVDRIVCGPPSKPYPVDFCPACDSRVEAIPDRPTVDDWPRTSDDRSERER